MAYTYPNKSAFIDIPSVAQSGISIDTTPTNISLSPITTPAYEGNVIRAILILSIKQIAETSGAGTNWTNGAQYIQLEDSGSTWRNAILIPSVNLICGASQIIGGEFNYMGNEDLTSYIAPSTSYNIRWASAVSTRDSINIHAPQPILRLYFD